MDGFKVRNKKETLKKTRNERETFPKDLISSPKCHFQLDAFIMIIIKPIIMIIVQTIIMIIIKTV